MVGNQALDSLRLWIHGDHGLTGFQFVSTEGEGPLWGEGEGAATAVIRFGEAPGKAIGLKIYLDSNDRPVTYKDVLVVGIQALVKSTGDSGDFLCAG